MSCTKASTAHVTTRATPTGKIIINHDVCSEGPLHGDERHDSTHKNTSPGSATAILACGSCRLVWDESAANLSAPVINKSSSRTGSVDEYSCHV